MPYIKRAGAPGTAGGTLPAGVVDGDELLWIPSLGLWIPASEFDPLTMVGTPPVLWTRADIGATPALWADQSGSGLPIGGGFVQAVAANQPVIGANGPSGAPSVDFDATNDSMVADFAALAQPIEIFALCRARIDTAFNNPSFWDGMAGATCRFYAAGAAPGSNVLLSAAAGATVMTVPADKRSWNVYNCVYNGAYAGTTTGSKLQAGNENVVVGTLDAGVPSGIRLNTFGGGGDAMGASFCEFMMFNAQKTERERALIPKVYVRFLGNLSLMALNPQDIEALTDLRDQVIANGSQGRIVLTPRQIRAILRALLDHEQRIQALEGP